jgi:hypothetical protein
VVRCAVLCCAVLWTALTRPRNRGVAEATNEVLKSPSKERNWRVEASVISIPIVMLAARALASNRTSAIFGGAVFID